MKANNIRNGLVALALGILTAAQPAHSDIKICQRPKTEMFCLGGEISIHIPAHRILYDRGKDCENYFIKITGTYGVEGVKAKEISIEQLEERNPETLRMLEETLESYAPKHFEKELERFFKEYKKRVGGVSCYIS